MGRIILDAQQTPAIAPGGFSVNVGYDLAGDVTSYTDGMGHTIAQSMDVAQHISGITSSLSDSNHPSTLVSGITHAPAGNLSQMTYVNGIVENELYNSRLQPCRINVQSSTSSVTGCTGSAPAGNVEDFQYGYNAGTSDNGNVYSWAATGTSSTPTFSRSYTYDNVNRLATMLASSDPSGCTGLSWSYDGWANRTAQTVTGGSCGASSTGYNIHNQMTNTGLSYDAAGNLTNDGSHGYTYDAENRLTAVDSGSTASYVYDANGRRVEKVMGSVKTEYVYDLNGNVLAEADGTATWANSYLYLGSQLVAEYKGGSSGTTYFVHPDHLGSTRLVTNLIGSVVECDDYQPFGEQLSYSTCSNTGDTSHKFTGKERDSESGLDNFGARYNSSQYGRFMTPDEIGPGQHPEDPQTWNMYSYVRNNPLSLVDPTGQYICDSNTVSQQQCDNFQAGLDRAQQAANKLDHDSDQYKNAQAAIDSYGKEGVDNGVTIAQGNTGNFAAQTQVAGTTVTPTTDNPNGQNIRVTLNQSLNLLGGTTNTADLGVLEAHEGSHVADASAWVSSGFSPSMNPTGYQTEFKAYQVSANLYNALGYMAATVSFAGRSYLLTSTLPAWTSNYTTTAINGIIKSEYPNANLAAFSRNTKLPRR